MMTANIQHKSEKIIVQAMPDIAQLIPGFLDGRRHDVEVLVRAVEQRDFEAVRWMGHNLKGLGKSYGFDPITELGREIEQAASAHQTEQVRDCTDLLAFYLDHVEVVYN